MRCCEEVECYGDVEDGEDADEDEGGKDGHFGEDGCGSAMGEVRLAGFGRIELLVLVVVER